MTDDVSYKIMMSLIAEKIEKQIEDNSHNTNMRKLRKVGTYRLWALNRADLQGEGT